MKYICLLRGINVGGKNLIKMSELKTLFELLGFSTVKTYIASGNVIFSSNLTKVEIKTKLEEKLLEVIGKQVLVQILNEDEMLNVISGRPKGFGENKTHFKYDVAFVIDPLTTAQAFPEFQAREGVDQIWQGEDVIYIAMDLKQLTKSWVNKIIENPIYPQISIRNWNTTEKLAELMKS